MNAVKMGKRLREARLAKKMTQAEVVDGFITRNMLSQIESGSATPSMKTLEFLAGRLDLSMASLMAEDEPREPMERLFAAKIALKMQETDEVLRLLQDPREDDPFYDEYCAILARAYGLKAEAGNDSAAQLAAYYGSLGIYRREAELEMEL
ncbi:MAG: helix-turn-helix transcriptional regulator [Clostridia bacterium]|nr:helix-turn-helix transcriptional regulator [Clostridia bacterium]